MGAFGPMHWLIIAAVVFLLFGNRLPSVMRSLGQGVVEFKKGLQGIEDDMQSSGTKSDEPNRQQVKDEAKPAEVEPAQR